MKRIIFSILLLISFAGFSQKVITYGGKAVTDSSKALTYTSGYCTEFQAVYDAFTTKPDATRAGYYNTAVKALVDGGYWSRIDLFQFYAYVDNTSGDALINWILPGTFDATNFNAPTHTADQGFLYNGATSYTMHNWIASVNGVNYTRNSASQILYIRTNITSAGAHGTYKNADIKNCVIFPKATDTKAYIEINDNTAISVVNANGSGLYINTRTGIAINKLYRNKVAIINGTTASTGVPTHKPYTGAYDDDDVAAGFRADQVAIVIYMDGCSQADVTGISDILNALMTSLGTNVYSPTWLIFAIMLVIFAGNRKKLRYEKDTTDINSDYRMAA